MAAVLGGASCTNYANTGVVPCTIEPSIFSYPILIPRGFVIPNASLTSSSVLNAYIAAKFIADSRSARWFLLPQITDLNDQTGDPVTENRNNYVKKVQNKPYNWTYRMDTTLCGYKSVKALADEMQQYFDVLFIDDMGTVIGKEALDSTGAAGMGGFSLFELSVEDWTQKTASANPMYMMAFRLLKNSEMTTTSVMMQSNFTVNTTTMGLANVALVSGTTAHTATHIYVNGNYGCGGTNLGETWGSTLAATAVWLVYNTATGAAITVSAASYNSSLNQYDLTITSSTGLTVRVELAAPSVITPSPYGAYLITEAPTDKLTVTLP